MTSSLIFSIAYFNVFSDFANLEDSTYSLQKKGLGHYRWLNHHTDLKKKLRGNDLGPRQSIDHSRNTTTYHNALCLSPQNFA